MNKNKLTGAITLARISNTPTIFTNVLVGSFLGGNMTINSRVFFISLAMFLFYWAGMYLNDLLDIKIDAKINPQRPLPHGIISPSFVISAIILFFSLGSIILIMQNITVFWAGITLILIIILYNLNHKGNSFGPFLMALCRVMVYLIAYLSFANYLNWEFFIAAAVFFIYMVNLSSYAKSEYKSDLIKNNVGILIASISIFDGLVLIFLGFYQAVPICVGAFLLTIYLQKFVKGT